MSKLIYRLAISAFCLTFILSFGNSATAQKRSRSAAPKPVVEKVSDAEKATTLENLQGAKVLQLLARLQLGIAEAYLGNRDVGETQANIALTKLMLEKIKNPSSIRSIYAVARGQMVYAEYLLSLNGFGKNVGSDERIKQYTENIRRDVAQGLALNADSAHIIAVRGTSREFDCRLKIKSGVADCYDLPLADLSRAIALQPDETDFFYMRGGFFERGEKSGFAEKDNQTTKSLGNAMELKLELDKTATARRPFHAERASAEMLYFMNIASLLQDEHVKTQLAADAATLQAFRNKLLEYYALADAGFERANALRPAAKNLELRATLRYHLGMFAADLGVEQPAEYAKKNYVEAVAFYTDAIKFDAKSTEAYENRARIYRKLGKFDLAEADEKQFNSLKRN